MSLREQIQRVILRGEVDTIHRGADRILAMQERDRERIEQTEALRSAPTEHIEVQPAARRRLRLIK
jgi:hypothetical protein